MNIEKNTKQNKPIQPSTSHSFFLLIPRVRYPCICALNSHNNILVKENTIIPVESIKRVNISHFKVIAFWKFTKDATCSKVLKNTKIIKKKKLWTKFCWNFNSWKFENQKFGDTNFAEKCNVNHITVTIKGLTHKGLTNKLKKKKK